MSKQILHPGSTTYRATCSECGAVFTYELEDVHTNYLCGGDRVACPQCGHTHLHLGSEGRRQLRSVCR